MKKILLFLATLVASVTIANQSYAQNYYGNDPIVTTPQQSTLCTFNVKDNQGEPVIGASIFIEGTTHGSISDMDGNAALFCRGGDIINVSYVGYQTQRIPYKGQKHINVTLQEDSELLDEVVVAK